MLNKLTELKVVGVNKWRSVYCQYRCHCGKLFITRRSSVIEKNTLGCGCLKGRPKHRLIGTITYKTWDSMKRRCNKPNAHNYKYYGARGIKVKYGSIIEMVKDIGLRPSKKYSIDRIDVNGHYEPGNCRWATAKEQSANRRLNLAL